MMRRLAAAATPLVLFLVAFAVFIGLWIGAYQLLGHFGFNNQATPQYGFTSGPGPMLLTALGMSTIVTGLWHAHNCQQTGCMRIGRHKVNGTPWCWQHHDAARAAVPAAAVPASDAEFRRLIESVDGLAEAIRAALLSRKPPG